MRKNSGMKSVVFLYAGFVVLLMGALLAAAIYMTHMITIMRPDGEVSRSNWPQQYAESFIRYIDVENGRAQIIANGVSSLDKNQLWVQILDEQGSQIAEHNKPSNIPMKYSVSELLDMVSSGNLHEYTVSISSFSDNRQTYEYIVGFPIGITKVTMYFNSDRFTSGRSFVFTVLAVICFIVLIVGLLYGAWLTKHLSRIVQSTGDIAARIYQTQKAKGVFGDAYKSLNELVAVIRGSDEVRAETERMQEEWITNITHDLRTPLSPIRGYAEFIADPNYTLSHENRIQYGNTILHNTEYAEKLINDLKLTYQLKNNMLPLDKKKFELKRFLKENVIEILNHPEYSNRVIAFDAAKEEITCCFDEKLLKRALDNLIYNALIHNTENTQIHVSLYVNDGITITIADNGKGMNSEKLSRLFKRYYRGTDTETNTGGTGLGMAIAKQIVEIHGGSISVDSEAGQGTRITIDFPLEN